MGGTVRVTRRALLGAALPGLVMALGPAGAAGAATPGAADPWVVRAPAPTGDVRQDTAALLAALDQCRLAAARAVDIGGGRRRYVGLPTLELARGDYVVDLPLELRYLHGLRIRGQGRWATRIVWAGAGFLLEIERSRGIEISGLRVSGRADAAAGPNGELQGLREGSGFARVRELRGDGVGPAGGNTLMISFLDLELEELHRGWSFEGDQMTDGVAFERVRLRDVFEGWTYRNSQAVNHTFRHMEFVWGVSFDPATVYRPRLRSWSSSPDLLDGAAVVVQSGGKATLEGCSFITAGPTFRVEDPPQDGSQLATTNIQPWTLLGCSWELRAVDPVGDANGLDRTAIVLPKTPYPAAGNAASQSRFNFYGCDWYSMHAERVLFYLRNDHRIRLRDSRVSYLGTPSTEHRLHCLVNARSAARPGGYLSDASTPLRVTRSSDDGTLGNPHLRRFTESSFS
jgi:hypothetical protein